MPTQQPAPKPLGDLGANLSQLPDAILPQALASTFQLLGLGASIRDSGNWHAVNGSHGVLAFELAHGKGPERNAHNDLCTDRARREKRSVLGHHAGLADFFVPILVDGAVVGTVVCGPFATARPTSTDMLERWRWITGRHGHPSDPEFSHFLALSLNVLTLSASQLQSLERWLACYTRLLVGAPNARTLSMEAAALGAKLQRACFAERMWYAARTLVDERVSRQWLSPQLRDDLSRLGLRAVPEHVIVGLLAHDAEERDPVAEVINRDAFQRACIDLALSENVICGRVGDHGVLFLVEPQQSAARAETALDRLAERAATLARRRFGLRLHLGVSARTSASGLGARYEQALAAAERALSEGVGRANAPRDIGLSSGASAVRRLRWQLADLTAADSKSLSTIFERYIEAIATRSGYRMESAQAHLEAGFDQVARNQLASGALGEKSLLDMCDGLDRAARNAVTLRELFSAYRRAISDLVDLVEHPVPAARDRSLRRAITFIHAHFVEPLRLPDVARVAGFAPAYFCELFKRRERMTFEMYVRQLRIQRAKQLLSTTELSTERIAQLSGFALRPYFHRVFKKVVGSTPTQYRKTIGA
jgi:AraC-like DNA-binding protein